MGKREEGDPFEGLEDLTLPRLGAVCLMTVCLSLIGDSLKGDTSA